MGITENDSATSRGLCRPHPEERACANASAKSNERARVSKDEDGHGMPSCFETHRSAADSCKRLCSRCDAPQHEGAAHFGETKPNERCSGRPRESGAHNHGLWLWVPALRPLRGRRPGRRSFMRTENQPVAAANAYRLRSIVSGLLFTMTRATCACTGTAADFGETNPMRILAKRTQCDVSESGG
jgi:hypothetical protein